MKVKNLRKCPKCGAEASDEALFCGICRAKFVEAPPPPAIAQTCSSCGAGIEPYMVYCTKCGQRITVKRICPSCGYENPIHAKFCTKCGSQLQIEAKQLEKPVPTPVALPPTVEKVLGGIEVAKGTTYVGATYYGLYFTPKRAIVAKTAGVSWIWVLVSLFIEPLLGIVGRRRDSRSSVSYPLRVF